MAQHLAMWVPGMSDQERLQALMEDWAQAKGLNGDEMINTLAHFIMVSGNTDRFAAYLLGLEDDEANEEGIGWPE